MDLYARSRCSLFRPHCVQFTHLRALLYETGHAGLCRRIQYARAPASGTDLSPEQQVDAELARYANAALAAQTDAAFLDSAESYYALMGEGFQSGSIVGDRETNDAALAYCRALSSSGITDIPASASDLPFLSFLPYAIATAPSFLPFIPFLLSSILVLGATRPATLAAKAPVPKFRRLIQIVFSIIVAGTAMLLAGLAPGGIYALVLNGFGQIGYPIAFFHDGALTTTTAGNVFTALLLALLAGGTLISVCSAVLSTATRRVLAGPLTSALLVAAPAFPLLSDSALGITPRSISCRWPCSRLSRQRAT